MQKLYQIGLTAQNNEIQKQEFKILGKIPKWLNGNLYLNASGKFQNGVTDINNISNLPEMVHHFTFENGKVFYQNRYIHPNIDQKRNENHKNKGNQFTYGLSQLPNSNFFDRLIKIDVKNKVELFWYEKNTIPGEPVFVPNPKGKSDDNGVVLSVVLDGESKHSFLLILKAKTMTELGSICLPHHIPIGFHGQFYQTHLNK